MHGPRVVRRPRDLAPRDVTQGRRDRGRRIGVDRGVLEFRLGAPDRGAAEPREDRASLGRAHGCPQEPSRDEREIAGPITDALEIKVPLEHEEFLGCDVASGLVALETRRESAEHRNSLPRRIHPHEFEAEVGSRHRHLAPRIGIEGEVEGGGSGHYRPAFETRASVFRAPRRTAMSMSRPVESKTTPRPSASLAAKYLMTDSASATSSSEGVKTSWTTGI